MLARRTARAFVTHAERAWCGIARCRARATAARVDAIWTGEDDRPRDLWTRHGSPEASAFAHRGILAEVGTTVRDVCAGGGVRRGAWAARARDVGGKAARGGDRARDEGFARARAGGRTRSWDGSWTDVDVDDGECR